MLPVSFLPLFVSVIPKLSEASDTTMLEEKGIKYLRKQSLASFQTSGPFFLHKKGGELLVNFLQQIVHHLGCTVF